MYNKTPLHYDVILETMPHMAAPLAVAQGMKQQALYDIIFQTFYNTLDRLEMFSLAHFERSGRQTFMVGTWLQKLFENTSLEDVSWDPLRHLPYQGFYICLSAFDGKIWSSTVKDYIPLHGIYAFQMWSVEELFLVFWGKHDGPHDLRRGDAIGGLCLDLEIAEKAGLKEYLKKSLETRAPRFGIGALLWSDNARDEQTEDTLFRAVHITVNLLQYLSLKDAETRRVVRVDRRRKRLEGFIKSANPTKKNRVKKKIAQAPRKINIVYVGETIEQEMPDQGEVVGKGRKPAKKHWVRGHYRVIPKGPRRNPYYERVWVKPFQRGYSERGSVARRIYKVREDKDEQTGAPGAVS